MAKSLNEDIVINIKALIAKTTQYEEGSPRFNSLEKRILSTLKRSDTMYFLNTKDIKASIASMAEKFMFHGFFKHAEHLQQCHDRYIDTNLSESDLTPRLNVVKFLLCISESPTSQFWRYPEKFIFLQEQEAEHEVVDWGAYLNEGIERWSPPQDDSFELSGSEDEVFFNESFSSNERSSPVIITESSRFDDYDFGACRSRLLGSVQESEGHSVEPQSEWFDANVGILWERHLEEQVRGLIQIDPVTVVSEYKVMREVLWQMWGPHNSTVFELAEDKLLPRSNITVSSVCSTTFEKFMEVFISYIELLDGFRLFYQELDSEQVPQTYKSYGEALKKITRPVFRQLIEIENGIREQESTMTLLMLAGKLETIFEPIRILKTIHEEVIVDFKLNSTLDCALTLLTRLRTSLKFSLNKLEQDIRLTLYLESFYYYFTLIDAWLVKNDLSDYSEEFVLLNNNERRTKRNLHQDHMNFFLQDIDRTCKDDGIIKIICEQVLHIGRNIHLLRLLGKYDVFAKGPETIHQEFIRRILDALSNYYSFGPHVWAPNLPRLEGEASYFDLNQMGDWGNYCDLTDGFLGKALEDFYEEEVEQADQDLTLFQKISNITTNLYPLQDLPEKVFNQILKERFTISGLMVKNLLIENYGLDKQFEFLNHIFLFHEDLIFPFYRRFFEKMNTENSNWGNSVWLTSHLQDIIMDLYPDYYEDCTVQVKDHWKQCRDSLEACTLLCLQYEIKWPLSIIITKEHVAKYRELFEFILKIKWALYTINHLSFTDLQPKKRTENQSEGYKIRIKRLKYLRFILINILNSIQHYLFGFIFNKYRIQFELDFEKSNDLKSLITSHEDFINSLFGAITEIRDSNRNDHGFSTLLKCVKMLKVMWNGREKATLENLDNCYKTYKTSFDVINSIVNPIYVFDY